MTNCFTAEGVGGGGQGLEAGAEETHLMTWSLYKSVTGGHQPVLRATSMSLCRVSARDTVLAALWRTEQPQLP